VKVRTAAIVPINILAAAKSRLADHLSPDDRRDLVLWMGNRVLASLKASEMVEAVAVVSPDRDVLRWAEERGVVPLYQVGGGLNSGLQLARHWAERLGAEALLVLLGDLPCLTPDEIAEFVQRGAGQAVVLAPDRFERGTNGLLVRLSVDLPFAFGEGSLERYRALSQRAGVTPDLYQVPGMAFDVDSFADLSMLYEFGIWMPEDRDELSLTIGSTPGGA
jgi:2-phospho-L-lactate/phosphoenolpyruvate guanylyltransferase